MTSPLVAIARGASLAAAGLFFAAYVVVAALRMSYPFELEWMEGGILDHVRLAADGQKIFAEPNLEFVSFLYPPLYYYAAVIPATIFGMEFHSLRLLSFVSSLGCLVVLFATVKKETGAIVPAFVAAGLYVATFDRSGGWMDLARIDSFYMLLLIAGLYGVAFARKPSALIGAGLALTAATLVKQSAIVIGAPVVLYAVIADRRRGVWWVGTWVALTASIAGLLDAVHDGWFRYYCWTVPRGHPVLPGAWVDFWARDMPPLLIGCALAVFYAAAKNDRAPLKRRLLFLAIAVGMIGSSWSVTSVVGAWRNNLMPAFAAVSILGALGLHRLLRAIRGKTPWLFAVWIVVVAQFAILAYDPRSHLPTAADRAAGESLVERLTRFEGEVFIPHHGYLAQRAGKPMQAHALGMDNIFLDDHGPTGMALRRELSEAFEERRWDVVLIESDGRYLPGVRGGYEEIGRVFDDPDVFWPVTGGRLRPEYVFVATRP